MTCVVCRTECYRLVFIVLALWQAQADFWSDLVAGDTADDLQVRDRSLAVILGKIIGFRFVVEDREGRPPLWRKLPVPASVHHVDTRRESLPRDIDRKCNIEVSHRN